MFDHVIVFHNWVATQSVPSLVAQVSSEIKHRKAGPPGARKRTEVKDDVQRRQGNNSNNRSMECPAITCRFFFHLKPPNCWIKLGGHCNDGQAHKKPTPKKQPA